jgi:hypothetical protein
MKTHLNLEKIITTLNNSAEGDALSALWHLVCFTALFGRDLTVCVNSGKLTKILVDGVEYEPTFKGINKAMRLGRCRKDENNG